MKTMTVGEVKAQFSEVLAQLVETGEPVAISYGRKKEKVAAIIPFNQLKSPQQRSLLEAMNSLPSGEHIEFELEKSTFNMPAAPLD